MTDYCVRCDGTGLLDDQRCGWCGGTGVVVIQDDEVEE